jgi:1-acyl-sn-glycerol-3-phosphate acyltransferase
MTETCLPPVSNRVLYGYRVFCKWLSFFIFGFSSLLMGSLIIPFMLIFIHPGDKFSKTGRYFIFLYMRFFVFIMYAMGIVVLDAGDRKAYKNLSSKIVVSNHPSLLDIVMLLSLIPNADCIVNSSLNRNIVGLVVRRFYIRNSLSYEELLDSCIKSLNAGNCIIIFPEGTRTPHNGEIKIKKGAARLSLVSQCGIVPVHFGGTDKYGLGKKDPWTAFNHRDKYIYKITMKKELSPLAYSSLPAPAAARALTAKIKEILFDQEEAAFGPGRVPKDIT